MSYKNTLDNPDDHQSTQPLGVDYLEYYQNKPILNAGKSTEGNDHCYKTNLCDETPSLSENGVLAAETKKKKNRRSLLGTRKNLVDIGSILNRNKNCENIFGTSSTGNNGYNLRSFTSKQNFQKPFQHAIDELVDKGTKSLRSYVPYKSEELQTPINPFLCEEELTSFFENGINNLAPWSVFKTSRNEGIKSPNSKILTKEEKTERKMTKPPPPRKSVKKLFDEHSIMKGYSHTLKEEEEDKGYQKKVKANIPSFQPSAKSSDEEDVFFDTESNEKIINKKSNAVEELVALSFSTNDINEGDNNYPFPSSTTTENSSTKSNKSPDLSIISEEEVNVPRFIKNSEIQSLLPDGDSSTEYDEKRQSSNKSDENIGLEQVTKLFSTVQKHSDNIDKILSQLNAEKEQYNLHFNSLLRQINKFQKAHKNKIIKF